MPEALQIEPDVLRRLADQHDQVAQDILKWGQQPTTWLNSFEKTYGKIAHPVNRALHDYYQAREDAAKSLAGEHERTADSLRKAADAYERTDHDLGHQISQLGNDGAPTSTAPQPTAAPSAGAPTGAPTSDSQPATPVAAGMGDGPGVGVGPDGQQTPGQTPDETSPIDQTPSITAETGPGALSDTGPTTGPTGPDGGGPDTTTPDGVLAGTGAGFGGGPGGGPGAGAGQEGGPSEEELAEAAAMAASLTPFAAAVVAAKDREAAPNYIVGEQVDDDIVLARTLLGAVLAAVPPPVGTTWAVSVMRNESGIGIFLNSNEGRGWLPPGLFLPREVSTPWQWDETLGEDTPSAAWEGISDPARVLAEFGRAWGGKTNTKLTALASSGPIDPGLRATLSNVPTEGMVGPSHGVDLRISTADTTDRLGLVGSQAAFQRVAATADASIPERTRQLAVEAHSQVTRSVSVPVEAEAARSMRDRILARQQAGEPVPDSWWEELRDADDLLAASMIAQRTDVSRVSLGEIRVDESAQIRNLTWERRCNELVLLLAQEPTRQTLRDAVYAHEQILAHPNFLPAPPPVEPTTEQPVERPAASSSAVSAPDHTVSPPPSVAPPTGVTAPPPTVTPPPVAGPPTGAVLPPNPDDQPPQQPHHQ